MSCLDMELVSRVVDTYLRTFDGTDAARLKFFEGLWDIQSQVASLDRPYEPPSLEDAAEALLSGQPLFLANPPALPVADDLSVASRRARYTSDMAGLPDGQADALRCADFAALVDQECLDSILRSPDDVVAKVASDLATQQGDSIAPATVTFVLFSALVPFLITPSRKASGAISGLELTASLKGQCPVCGSAATLGRVGESTNLQGAQRSLWCGLCHAEWGCERMSCVRCGNRNSESLRYTYVEGDPAHRLHLCEECHGYARFVFADDLGKPVSMIVEDAVTVTLDALASAMGYLSAGQFDTKH